MELSSPIELANLPVSVIKENNGRGIIDKYPSYSKLLQTLFPNEDWENCDRKKHRGYWSDLDNVREFIEKLKQNLSKYTCI